jgi:NAD(P)-dependent dehydrogenase (short-subunit alcohol dehydrogenase family)
MPMLPVFQSPVHPLPSGIDLTGQTAIVTGATKGIGHSISSQLLSLNLSTLIIAVRNVSQGESVRQQFLTSYPNAKIEVIQFDAADFTSVLTFAKTFKERHDELHIAMLNAGLGSFGRQTTPNGHEICLQVNYLANVLLSLELLPLLEATADKTGTPSHLTWTGSTMYRDATFGNHGGIISLPPGETNPIHYINSTNSLGSNPNIPYCNSKYFVIQYLLELSTRIPSDKVIINNFCPGMVSTNMTDVVPLILRLPLKLFIQWRGRSVEQGAWLALDTALVAGKESHGKFLHDKKIQE